MKAALGETQRAAFFALDPPLRGHPHSVLVKARAYRWQSGPFLKPTIGGRSGMAYAVSEMRPKVMRTPKGGNDNENDS